MPSTLKSSKKRIGRPPKPAGPPEVTMAFRHLLTRRRMLELFATEDGFLTDRGSPVLTPMLRKITDYYIAERLRLGRDPAAEDAK